MEKYFIIKDECGFKKDRNDYLENVKKLNEVVKEFFNIYEIEANKYYLNTERLYIIPTENDIAKFDNFLTKAEDYGLRAFKKNSKINKEFVKYLKDKNMKVLIEPLLWMYINFTGRISTQVFMHNDVMYAKIETDNKFKYNEEYFKEIKASEYYTVKELYENK